MHCNALPSDRDPTDRPLECPTLLKLTRQKIFSKFIRIYENSEPDNTKCSIPMHPTFLNDLDLMTLKINSQSTCTNHGKYLCHDLSKYTHGLLSIAFTRLIHYYPFWTQSLTHDLKNQESSSTNHRQHLCQIESKYTQWFDLYWFHKVISLLPIVTFTFYLQNK